MAAHHFPTNALPAEFEQEHGSVDLADAKPVLGEDGGEDEDLGIQDVGQRVWLVKVPKFLMEKWNQVQEEGVVLGRVRVYDEKDVNGDPKIAVILDDPSSSSTPSSSLSSSSKIDVKGKGPAVRANKVPSEYKLTLQNTATKNMFVFGEKEEEVKDSGEEGHRKRRRITSLLGTVHHECSLTPSLYSMDASSSYRTIMRDRQKKASEPKRTVKMLDVDQATQNRLASGVGLAGVRGRVSNFVRAKPAAHVGSDLRAARIPRNELLDMLFRLFESAQYWKIKDLTEHVKQPQVYLKEVLSDIAQLIPRGPYVGLWTLKDEYKGKGQAKVEVKEEAAAGPAPEALDDNDEDEEMEEVSGM